MNTKEDYKAAEEYFKRCYLNDRYDEYALKKLIYIYHKTGDHIRVKACKKKLRNLTSSTVGCKKNRFCHRQPRKHFLTVESLIEVLKHVCYVPHSDIRVGRLHLRHEVFIADDRETNIIISPAARMDTTGDITIGPWTMIGDRTVIYTHDHFHDGRHKPLLLQQEERGVKWSNLTIGEDVWLHGCTILQQVSEIPNGVIIGAGAVLTKNPGPYEIWAGNPAKKIGER
jgi:acetyltransferase-like isoleucine patch superfamily enzyme